MATTLTAPIFLSKVREAGRTSWTVVKHTCLGFFQWCRILCFCFPNGLFEPHELNAVVSAIRIVPNGLQFIPRVPACTTAAFILQPLPKNWNFLVLVFSRIRPKPTWTLRAVDYCMSTAILIPSVLLPFLNIPRCQWNSPTSLYVISWLWVDRWME